MGVCLQGVCLWVCIKGGLPTKSTSRGSVMGVCLWGPSSGGLLRGLHPGEVAQISEGLHQSGLGRPPLGLHLGVLGRPPGSASRMVGH